MGQLPSDKNDRDSTTATDVGRQSPSAQIPREEDGANFNGMGKKPRQEAKNWPFVVQAICAVFIVIITAFYTHYAKEQVDQIQKQGRLIGAQTSALKLQIGQMQQQVTAAKESADAAQESVKIAERAFVSTERPWIKIINAKLSPTGVSFEHNTINVTISFQLKNVGLTPASHVKFSVKCLAINPADYRKIGEKLTSVCLRAKKKEYGFNAQADVAGFIFPNETSRKLIIGESVPYTWFQQHDHTTSNNVSSLLLIIYVTYTFTFNSTIHITGTAYTIRRKDNTMISPPQVGDVLIGKLVRYIPNHKLEFQADSFGYAD